MSRRDMSKITTLTVIAVSSSLLLAGCAGGGTPPGAGAGDQPDWAVEMGPAILTLSNIGNPNEGSTKGMVAMAEHLEEVSGGAFSVDVFDSASLLPQSEELSGTASGVADIVQTIAATHSGDLPVSAWLAPLAAGFTKQWPVGNLVGSAATAELFTTEADLIAEYERNNLRTLTAQNLFQQYDFVCTEPVTSLQDLAGRLTRSPGPVWSAELETLGMVPVNLPGAELYEGLQRGTVECAVGTPTIHVNLGLIDIAKHYSPVSMTGFNGYAMVMNKDRWDSMNDGAKRAIQDAAQRSWEVIHEEYFTMYAGFGDAAAAANVQTTDAAVVNEINAALEAHQQRAIADMVKNAPAQVTDPQGLIDRYLALVEKWQGHWDAMGIELPPVGSDAGEVYQAGSDADFSKFYDLVALEVFGIQR